MTLPKDSFIDTKAATLAKAYLSILREDVVHDVCYVSRWNDETKQVEPVIGEIRNPLTKGDTYQIENDD